MNDDPFAALGAIPVGPQTLATPAAGGGAPTPPAQGGAQPMPAPAMPSPQPASAPASSGSNSDDPFAAMGAIPVQAPSESPNAAAPAATSAAPVPGVPQQAAPTSPASPAHSPSMLESFAATLNGIPRGMGGSRVVDAIDAATQTPIRMLTGMQGPVAAYNEAADSVAKRNKEITDAAPMAQTAGQIGGALVDGIAAAPAMGWNAATGALGRLGAAGSYLARNAALGGTMAAANGDDVGTGAALGAALPGLHIAGSTIAAPFRALAGVPAKLFSHGAQEASVAKTLGRDLGSSQIETSPVGPLDLGQATNNANIASKVDIARDFAPQEAAALRESQRQAVADQVGQFSNPVPRTEASSALVGDIRQARNMAGAEENRLWTVPELSQVQVDPKPVADSVNAAIASMDPVFANSMSPQLQALRNQLANAPTTSVRDLNGIRSDLAQIARKTTDGSERAIATKMSSAFMDGFNNLPELTSNPQIAPAYAAARDYSRQMRGMFGDPDFAALVKRDGSTYKNDASTGAARLFKSTGATEGPQQVSDLSDLVSKMQQPGAGALSDSMKQNARAYIGQGIIDAAGANDGQVLKPAAMNQFLDKNSAWMQASGIFTKPQLDAVNDLRQYGEMLRRPDLLRAQAGSQTASRSAARDTFIDQIMSPWMAKIPQVVGMFAGGAHGGAGHGLMGGMVGNAVGHGAEGVMEHAQGVMRETMAQALLDPQVAAQLRMKASAGNARMLSAKTRNVLDSLRVAAGDVYGPELLGQSTATANQ